MEANRIFFVTLPAELRLNIGKYLGQSDLYKLSLVCRATQSEATEQLYKKDAREGNSYAIAWAARTSSICEAAAFQTLKLSLCHGGSIDAKQLKNGAFASIIHIAAAHGSRDFVKELLTQGANVHSRSIRPWEFLNLDLARKLRQHTGQKRIRGYYCLPLLLAMFRPDFLVAEELIAAHCTPYLAIQTSDEIQPSREDRPLLTEAYTIHHMLIASNIFMDQWDLIFRHFRAEVIVLEPASRMPLLMKTLEEGNVDAAEFVFKTKQNLDILSPIGWSSLAYAAKGALAFDRPKRRNWSADMLVRLLERGANPNAGRQAYPLEIPLRTLLEKQLTDADQIRRTKKMIFSLLDHHADLNVVPWQGPSIGQAFFTVIENQPTFTTTFQEIFFRFLECGIDVNHLFPDGTSLLGRSLGPRFKSRIMADKLLKSDARTTPREFDGLFRSWVKSEFKFPKEFSLQHHIRMLSQDTIDWAYRYIVKHRDDKKYEILKENWRPIAEPNRLVRIWLQHNNWHRDDMFALDFDPNWQGTTRAGHAHVIVERLRDNPQQANHAIEDIKRLIERGLKVGLRDSDGCTAYQRLNRLIATFDECTSDVKPLMKLKTIMGLQRLKEIPNET
ncbi:hypothetical protein NQ176_g6178 [Zarea fungicola]|uniref:Uncharacterized protein n=1 Tax=Zarea fungicola TaxID=93591 RepID=A0ACC1N5S6_9HYPO|nr:hypothetical protein NQ176_g6178 [Lecanicillium fungicola]